MELPRDDNSERPVEANPFALGSGGASEYAPPIMQGMPAESSRIRCVNCGYDLTGTAIGSYCPECGAEVARSVQSYQANITTSGYATASLICGILSFVICAVLGVVAIVLYFPAMNDVRSGRAGGPSKSFAIAGLVLGLASIAINIIVIGVLVLAAMM